MLLLWVYVRAEGLRDASRQVARFAYRYRQNLGVDNGASCIIMHVYRSCLLRLQPRSIPGHFA